MRNSTSCITLVELRSSHTVRVWALVVIAVLLEARPSSAARLQVLAGSTVRIEPRVQPDRTALIVTVRAQDDRRRPARGAVRLTAIPESGSRSTEFNGDTDERGEA